MLIDSAPGKPRILMEMCNKIHVPFMPTEKLFETHGSRSKIKFQNFNFKGYIP